MGTYYTSDQEYFNDQLYHHGIIGMKWGHRNGPPYPLSSEDHSASEKKAGWRQSLKDHRVAKQTEREQRLKDRRVTKKTEQEEREKIREKKKHHKQIAKIRRMSNRDAQVAAMRMFNQGFDKHNLRYDKLLTDKIHGLKIDESELMMEEYRMRAYVALLKASSDPKWFAANRRNMGL